MLERTPRRTFLRLLAAAPLAALALRSDGARAKRRKHQRSQRIPQMTYEGYNISPWRTKTITVRDHMPARWHPVIEAQAQAVAKLIPASGPHVIYEAAEHRYCEDIYAEQGKDLGETGVLIVCDKRENQQTATAFTDGKNGWVSWGFANIPDGWFDGAPENGNPASQRVSCHEMMHAFLKVTDRLPEDAPKDSCVLGPTPFPGSWDKAAFALLYPPDFAPPPTKKTTKGKRKRRR